jgi:hypothetical protein
MSQNSSHWEEQRAAAVAEQRRNVEHLLADAPVPPWPTVRRWMPAR